jgi:PadR family transcriptional regulator, regulatory protein PadR
MIEKQSKEALYENLALELRRGVLVLAVLGQLHQEQYGYSLKQMLSEQGLEIKEGTLYPLLRRLESQELLESYWEVVNDTRPRRYYRISSAGKTIFANLKTDWHSLVDVMAGLTNDK